MQTITFKQDYNGASAGTKLFWQSGMWSYKTDTETECWLTDEFVKSNMDLFKWEMSVWDLFHVKLKEDEHT